MNLNWIESVLYGFISGLSEFLPISSQAHQQIFLHILGSDQRDPVRDLFVNIALLCSIFTACRSLIDQIRRDSKQRYHSRRGRHHSSHRLLDLKLIQNASIPLTLAMLLLSFFRKTSVNLIPISLLLLLNGTVIFIASRTLQGNKDARSMSFLDSTIIGSLGALSIFPGLSRVGLTTSSAIVRGADKQQALNWSLVISIPALVLLTGLNLISAFTYTEGIHLWTNLFTYILSSLGAYIGGYLSIITMRLIASNFDFSGFAFYSWGAALFTFIIYLTVV